MYRITGSDIKSRYKFVSYITYFLEHIVVNMKKEDYYNIDDANKRITKRHNSFSLKMRNKSYLSNGTLVDTFELKNEIYTFIKKLKKCSDNCNDFYLIKDIFNLINKQYQYIILDKIVNELEDNKLLILMDIEFDVPNVKNINITNLSNVDIFRLAHKTATEIETNYGQ